MKAYFFVLDISLFLGLSVLCGCSTNYDTPIAEAMSATHVNSQDSLSSDSIVLTEFEERLFNAMNEIFENESADYDDGGYIIYTAEDDSFMVVSETIYGIGQIAGDWMEGKNVEPNYESNMKKAPKGKDWKWGGRCKGRTQALKLAIKISKLIPKGRDFEIHSEYDKLNDSYNVWYRII